MTATATLCSCPRRRNPSDESEIETPCGEPLTLITEGGKWYWCLYCDAHWSDCANKGSPDYSQCPNDPPPPCRTEPL